MLLGRALVVIGAIGVFFARLIQDALSRLREFLADAPRRRDFRCRFPECRTRGLAPRHARTRDFGPGRSPARRPREHGVHGHECSGRHRSGRRRGHGESARTHAFAVLVVAELLRSFGARSETQPVWRISLFTNVHLVVVVAIFFGFQLWSQHNAILGRFLKTSFMPHTDGFLLLALGAIPLWIWELVKVVRKKHRGSPPSTGGRVTPHSCRRSPRVT